MFNHSENKETIKFRKKPSMQHKKRNLVKWTGIIASAIIVFGIASIYTNSKSTNSNLGTFNNPEVALIETEKALFMLSENVSCGVESVVVLNEFNKTKQTIFK